MSNVAVILAGGIGSRMGLSIPKQFSMILGKPVIVHTIMNFEKSDKIDSVLVVCKEDWIDHLRELISEYGLRKVKWIIPHGETGHDSTSNGIMFLRDIIGPDDYVIIHDAARPILPQAAIDDMLRVAYEKGNASLAIPCHETVLFTKDGKSGIKDLDRKTVMRIQTPQAYRYGEILPLYERAKAEDKHDFIYADLVLIHYGKRVYFSKGFMNNIKITTQDDISLCAALMSFTEEQLFGQ